MDATHGSNAEFDSATTHLLIGVCTFRRPEGLRALVSALPTQRFTRIARPRISVLAVDNDCDAAVAALTRELAQCFDFEVRYHAEARRGIAQARNALIANVSDDVDWVLFVDDDEVPRDDWLEEMLLGVARSSADAISGYVVAAPVPGYPRWVRDGRFFTSPRGKDVADYSEVGFGVMGNFLLNAAFLRTHALAFDERLGLVGSEDKAFFMAIRAYGGKLSFTSRAVLDHFVPASRAQLGYLLRREFRVGCGRGLALRYGRANGSSVARFAGRAALRLLVDTLLLPFKMIVGLFSNNHFERVKPLFDIAQWAGRLYGAVGARYEQYLHE